MTKSTFAKGVSKAVPVVGGLISGGITLVTLAPMGLHLANTLEQAHFGYDEKAFQADWQQVLDVIEQEETLEKSTASLPKGKPKRKTHTPSWLRKIRSPQLSAGKGSVSAMDEIRKAKQLMDEGVLTSEEFAQAKAHLLSRMSTQQE